MTTFHSDRGVEHTTFALAEVAHKRCRECGEQKLLAEFHRHPSTLDHHDTICKACKSLDSKRRYETRDQPKPIARPQPVGQSKHCRVCGKLRDLSMFHRRPDSPDGRFTYCKECQQEYDYIRRTLGRPDRASEFIRTGATIRKERTHSMPNSPAITSVSMPTTLRDRLKRVATDLAMSYTELLTLALDELTTNQRVLAIRQAEKALKEAQAKLEAIKSGTDLPLSTGKVVAAAAKTAKASTNGHAGTHLCTKCEKRMAPAKFKLCLHCRRRGRKYMNEKYNKRRQANTARREVADAIGDMPSFASPALSVGI